MLAFNSSCARKFLPPIKKRHDHEGKMFLISQENCGGWSSSSTAVVRSSCNDAHVGLKG
jgi:hypothetical protein